MLDEIGELPLDVQAKLVRASRPAPGEPRRTLNPRVAARDRWTRIESLGRLVEVLRSYRSAWTAWRAGDESVTFPSGHRHLRVGR